MNSSPLISNNNINNRQQYCKGCEKNLPLNLFISNEKSFRTCETCCTQNKVVQQKKSKKNDDQMFIDFPNFIDFIAEKFENIANNDEDQENNNTKEFKVSCILNISTLTGNSKERAGHIVEIISDVDEYIWVYQSKYNLKKSKKVTYYYYCSQRDCLSKEPKKNSEINKQRDRQQYCKGCEKNLPLNLFISNEKSFRTCETCCTQNKVVQQKKSKKNDDQMFIDFPNFIDFIAEKFENIANNDEDQENNNTKEFKVSCILNISTLTGNSKERAGHIVEIISDVDEYIWVYQSKYNLKKSKKVTYYYYCSQRDCLSKEPKKNSEINKQQIEHHLYSVQENVVIFPDVKNFILENIDLLPREIYKRLIETGLNINICQKQIHFWWTELGKSKYKYDDDAFLSAQKWLKEKSYEIIFQKETPKAIGFLTNLWNLLLNFQFKIHEIGVDTTLHAEVDGMGFPLAYLFLENNGNCDNGIRTGTLIDFFEQLKNRGLEPEFFVTDKDFTQISAAQFVWKNIKIQLCLWHIKKAVEARLANNKKLQQINYNGVAAQQLFPFINLLFRPTLSKDKISFCPKELHLSVWKLMNKHLHQHPLIPTNDVYLWNEWYSQERWALWFRAGCENKISILKTNMFVEAHWKVLKRDFLYKFFRPRLNLVIFIIMEKVIPHQKRKFEQVFLVKREKADWRKPFKKEWKDLAKRPLNEDKYLTNTLYWICSCSFFFTNHFFICKHLVQQKGIVDVPFFDQIHHCYEYPFLNTLFQINNSNQFLQITSNIETIENEKLKIIEKENLENEECEELYNHLIDTMEKSLEILKDQQSKKNFKWIKGVEKNFIPIQKMLSEITLYKCRRVMFRTFKDHSCNTMFFN
ncbi:hypothetical protein Glove_464g61 [Diversispora epigaea]|uniref:SWIM-type domain-containing protein n=1 Tax=Diversispora epigaea TaxID=1348612 RepID=A0A397GPE1_9GLOM|nr:hypothetical protein Glove_464g61 [Diversispora epigaea]